MSDDSDSDPSGETADVDAGTDTDTDTNTNTTTETDAAADEATADDRVPVLLVRGDREFLIEPGAEQGTDLGVLEVPEDVQPGDTVETHLGEAFQVRRLRGPDLFHQFERTGAPMVPRDVGLVIGETGVSQGDRVLDTGTGTGVLAASMARAGADVVSYERDPEFADVARENMELGGVEDAVDVRTGDLATILEDGGLESETGDGTDLEPSSFDVLTLDTGDAADIVEYAPELLVDGGFVAVYSPFIESTREVVETARAVDLSNVRTRETIQREMQFDDRGSRPSTAPVGHTGYLTLARNV
ncbi:tRNA methyltransferase complex GCD14 subunit [Natronolimnohabitans innermongolicus JCM 12255]|uniref:tRNA methyltransferase complex GCD14 subunit n=1 Tax=Natronolimnohabitans innermongolicus JCM 12255 TaxID=1227499 RepID=L9XBP9_9EURY|nr:tRNA methyltransferase complex GCD14 subunit [Natronolimnohabitans innermongolicus JCM 12255]